MSFLEGFAKGWSDVQDRKERRDLFLREEKQKYQSSIDKAIGLIQDKAEDQNILESRANYLSKKGLDDSIINVLVTDPDRLNAAYEVVSTEWNTKTPEELNSNFKLVGDPSGVTDWKDYYGKMPEVLEGWSEGTITPSADVVQEFNKAAREFGQPNQSDAFVDITMPKQAKLSKDRIELQKTVFDNHLMKVVDADIDLEADAEKASRLRKLTEDYASGDPRAVQELQKQYGPQALNEMLQTGYEDVFLQGLQSNPFLRMAFPSQEGVPQEGVPATQTTEQPKTVFVPGYGDLPYIDDPEIAKTYDGIFVIPGNRVVDNRKNQDTESEVLRGDRRD